MILNTVKQAQAVYKELDLPGREKMLFHARFSAGDRERIANTVSRLFGRDRTARPVKFVLVATQVVEQSLDVDFDVMISEIAPVDLLLQRSGRMHRHRARETDPVLNVLIPVRGDLDFGATRFIYRDKPLLRTLGLLEGRDRVNLPGDFRALIESCYGRAEWDQDSVPWAAIRTADSKWDEESASLAGIAGSFTLVKPDSANFRPVDNTPVGDDDDDGQGWRARTRLGACDRTVFLLSADALGTLNEDDLTMSQIRDIYRRTVKLPGYLPLSRPDAGHSPAVVGRGRLKGLILLPLASDGNWRGSDESGKAYSIQYDDELGLTAGRTE